MKPLKRRDGLLNTTIAAESSLMALAKKNSLDSPLLCLPAELRTKIWEYTLGGHEITILYHWDGTAARGRFTVSVLPLDHIRGRPCPSFIAPTFKLPQVCRQVYTETALLLYKLNTFKFDCIRARDLSTAPMQYSLNRWLKSLCPVQRRAVTSVKPTPVYLLQYERGQWPNFKKTFPGLKSVDVSILSRESQLKVERAIKEREGEELEVVGSSWNVCEGAEGFRRGLT